MFAGAVKGYKSYVTPRCAPEIVAPYNRLNWRRDLDFGRSLKGTSLEAVYTAAVRDQIAAERSTVHECFGPPPSPPPPGTSTPAIDRRTYAISDAQARLGRSANDLPAYFDEADALFTRMAALRDTILGRKEP